jgi:hypothetical protein
MSFSSLEINRFTLEFVYDADEVTDVIQSFFSLTPNSTFTAFGSARLADRLHAALFSEAGQRGFDLHVNRP